MTRLLSFPLSLLVVTAMFYAYVTPAAACSCAALTEDEEVAGVMDYYGTVVEGRIAPQLTNDPLEHIRFVPEVVYGGDITDDELVLTNHWGNREYISDSGPSSLGPDCSFGILGDPGERYVLFLEPAPDAIYKPAGCASFALADLYAESPFEPGSTLDVGHQMMISMLQERYDAIRHVAGVAETPVPTPAPSRAPAQRTEDQGGTEYVEIAPVAPAPKGVAPIDERVPEHDEDTPWAVVLPLAFAIPLAVLFGGAFVLRRTPGGH